jgi:hypothetical protein
LETAEKFIVPLVRPYLLQNESKFSALSDEAIRLYAEIIRRQPWERYKKTVCLYIDDVNKTENSSKPIIRVLVALLSAFNFDFDEENLPHALEHVIIPRLRKCIQPPVSFN